MDSLFKRKRLLVCTAAQSGLLKSVWTVLIVALLQLFSTNAFAHASLIDSQPADAATLSKAPGEFVLHFNEAVAPLVFKLVLPDGSILPLDQTTVIVDGLKIALPETAAAGTYLLSWRVVSADGHPVGGALSYVVGAPSAETIPVANSATTATTATTATIATLASSAPLLASVIWLSRFGLYLSMFFSIGGIAFFAFFSRDVETSPTWITVLVICSWFLLPVAVGAQGLDALAASWGQLSVWLTWKTSLNTSYGLTATLMLAASIVVLLGNFKHKIKRTASVIALCLFGCALASSGHAASAPPTWLARPVVFLHAVAICLWIGSLPPLMLSLRRPQGPLGPLGAQPQSLTGFSRIIPWVLLVLLLSGVTLATLQLPHLSELWRSDYGKILFIKLALLAALLLVAAGNRYVLTKPVERGDVRATRWMTRLIVIELLLVVLILAAATTWRFTPPPRALAVASPVALHVHIHTAQAMADVTLIPHNHQVSAEVFLANGEGAPLQAKEVALQFSNPQQGLEPLTEDMTLGENQTWKTAPFVLPATGRWHVRIDILVSDFDSISLEDDFVPTQPASR